MTRFTLHLGYPKTATSTLQQHVFHRLHEAGHIHYLGMFFGGVSDVRKAFFEALTEALYLDDQAFEAAFAVLADALDAALAGVPKDRPVVLSNEHLVLCQGSSTLIGAVAYGPQSAQRLAKLFTPRGSCTLLMATRRQDALIRSLYLQRISRAGHAHGGRYSSFDAYIQACLTEPTFTETFFAFDRMDAAYAEAFPQAERLIWTYEGFCDTPDVHLARLLSAIAPDLPIPSGPGLPRENARSGRGGEVVVAREGAVHRLAHSLGHLPLLRRAIERMPLRHKLSQGLKSAETVRPLTPQEQATIVTYFTHHNRALTLRHPDLAADFDRYGYLNDQPAADRSPPIVSNDS